jgi:hypothetical protein
MSPGHEKCNPKDAVVLQRVLKMAEKEWHQLDKENSKFDRKGRVVKLDLSWWTHLRSLPHEIGKLSQLQVLRLDGCSNLLTLPPEIGKLANLKVLDLQGCGLSAIPPEVGALSELRVIDVSYAKYLATIPDEVVTVIQKQLRKLRMAYCQQLDVPDLIVNRIQQSETLEYLDVSFNQLLESDFERLFHIWPRNFPTLLVVKASPNSSATATTMSNQHYRESIVPRIARFEDNNMAKKLLSSSKPPIKPSVWPMVLARMDERHSCNPDRRAAMIYHLLRNEPVLLASGES